MFEFEMREMENAERSGNLISRDRKWPMLSNHAPSDRTCPFPLLLHSISDSRRFSQILRISVGLSGMISTWLRLRLFSGFDRHFDRNCRYFRRPPINQWTTLNIVIIWSPALIKQPSIDVSGGGFETKQQQKIKWIQWLELLMAIAFIRQNLGKLLAGKLTRRQTNAGDNPQEFISFKSIWWPRAELPDHWQLRRLGQCRRMNSRRRIGAFQNHFSDDEFIRTRCRWNNLPTFDLVSDLNESMVEIRLARVHFPRDGMN